MEELMALLRTIAGDIQDDDVRKAAMESVEVFGKALNRKPAEAQAPAEAEGEDAEIRAVEAYRERIRNSLADILEDIAIKAVTSNAEEIERLAEAACGIVTTLHLAGLLRK